MMSGIAIPVVGSGRFTVASLGGNAIFSVQSAQVGDIQLKGVKLSPLADVPQRTVHRTGWTQPERTVDAPSRFALTSFASENPLTNQAVPPISGVALAGSVNLSKRTLDFLAQLNLSSPDSVQQEAITASRSSLKNLAKANILVHIPAQDATTAAKAALLAVGLPNSELAFRDQQVLLTVPYKVTGFGDAPITFLLALLPTIEGNVLVVRYALQLVSLTSVSIPDSTRLDSLISSLQTGSKAFKATIEAPETRAEIALPFNFIQAVDLNRTPPPDPQTHTQIVVKSVPTPLTLQVIAANLLIDSAGFHVLTQLQLHEDNALRTILILATLIFVREAPVIAQTTEPQATADSFGAYVSDFRAAATTTLGPESLSTWSLASVYVSKGFIADSAADAFNKSGITIQAVFPRQVLNPQPKPFDLVMPHIIKSCDPPCPHCGGGPIGWACDGVRASCLIEVAPTVAACLVAKSALDLAAGLALGHVSPSDMELEARMKASSLQLSVMPDLSSASLATNLDVDGIVRGKANISLTPLAGVFTACWPSQSITVPETGISLATHNLTGSATLALTPTPHGVRIDSTISKVDFDLALCGNFSDAPDRAVPTAKVQKSTSCKPKIAA
jgi:hypothetical protein